MKDHIIIGIDVSKNFGDICAISTNGDVLLKSKIFYDQVGLRHFQTQLENLCVGELNIIVAVMESTAHYHRILEQYLRNIGVTVVVINPIQSGSMKNLEIRKIKSDRTDAKRLAQLYLFKMLKASTQDTAIIGTLKDLSRQRADIIAERTKFSNKLTALLDQGFPGFRKVFSGLKVKSALAVIRAYPVPQSVLIAGRPAIKKVLAESSGKSCNSKYVSEKTELLLSTAKEAQSICIGRESFSILISLYAEMIMALQRTADEIESNLMAVAQRYEMIWNSVELLTSIPGIGRYSAIVILAEIGDFSRFRKPKQLVAYAGLDPSVKQSGNHTCTHNRISKRGSPYLRSILDTCTHVAVHPGKNKQPANPILSAYYAEKSRSRPAKVAQCACIHKMLGYIFAVLRDQKPFTLRTLEEHLEIMRAQSGNQAA